MAKNTNRVASAIAYVAALGLATGVAADHWELTTEGDVTYAAEIFGDDADTMGLTLLSDVTTGEDADEVDESTRVELALYKADDGDIDTDSEIILTVTLNGAEFRNTVGIDDIELSPPSTVGNNPQWEIVRGSRADGRIGDSSVSVGIRVVGELNNELNAIDTLGPEDRPTVTLRIPAIQSAEGLAIAKSKVTVSAEVELYGTCRGVCGNFPIIVTGTSITDNEDTLDVDESGLTGEDMMQKYNAGVGTIASSVQALTFAAAAGGTSAIDLEDRTMFADAKPLLLGSLSVTTMAAMTADLEPFSLEENAKGNIDIDVSGSIRSDDTVFYDVDKDVKPGTKEMLDIGADGGTASGDFSLDETADLPRNVYYMSGETAMERGSFSTTFSVSYDSAKTVNPGAIKPATASTEYDGLNMEAQAYAIPNLEHPDLGNVRIKCERTDMTPCTVFLECNTQTGEMLFGEVGEIDAGATLHMQETGIADILGVDTWMGRLSCDVLSSGDASTQVLVRSGASLVNNTYVDDRSGMDDLAADIAAIMTAVGGVKTAVGGVSGQVKDAIEVACDMRTSADDPRCPAAAAGRR